MLDDAFRADCARCAALCCVTLAFDRSALFGFDKAAGAPCPHLTARDRCRIHGERERFGFAGCAAYDCLGAGQRVTQELFAGRSWREDPRLGPAMFEAFGILRDVHELLLFLKSARMLPLSRAQRRELRRLERRLDPPRGWSLPALMRLEHDHVPGHVRHFLTSLRPLVKGRRLPIVD